MSRVLNRRDPVTGHIGPSAIHFTVRGDELAARRIQRRGQPFRKHLARSTRKCPSIPARAWIPSPGADRQGARHRIADVPHDVGVDEVLRRRAEPSNGIEKVVPVGSPVDPEKRAALSPIISASHRRASGRSVGCPSAAENTGGSSTDSRSRPVAHDGS